MSIEPCTLIFAIIYLPREVSPSHFASLASEKYSLVLKKKVLQRKGGAFENRAQSSPRGTSLPLQGPGTQMEEWED